MSCKHYPSVVTSEDRYYVLVPEHNNCMFCLIDAYGNMTQEKVGKYLGLSKMRINQIEKRALGKLKKRLK